MKRMNYSALERSIKVLVEKSPLKHPYEKTSEPYSRSTDEYYDYLGTKILKGGDWSWYQRKSIFIYQVIFSGIYHIDEGRRLRVSDVEIQDCFNKFTRTWEVIEGFEHLDEFHSYMYSKALEVVKIEQEELEVYKGKSFFRKFIDTDSILSLHLKEISITSKNLRRVDKEVRSLIADWKKRRISVNDLEEGRNKLDDARSYYRDKLDYLLEKYKGISERKLYRDRRLYKSCFEYKDIYVDQPADKPTIRYRNLSTVTFMMKKYCIWHKERFAEEIEISKEEMKQPSAREMENKRRSEKLNPYIKSSLSFKKIADETGISKSSVQRILSELRK